MPDGGCVSATNVESRIKITHLGVQSGLSEGRGQRQPTTNTKVTAIMQDVGPRNYSEFNEPLFCNEAVLWAVDENGWALLACRSV